MALSTNEQLDAVVAAYNGANVLRAGPLTFNIDTTPRRMLVFEQAYYDANVTSATSFTVAQLAADIQAKKVTGTSAKNVPVDRVR
jgi:hypothetical protein